MSCSTDPIADMFAMISNANRNKAEKVDIPSSKYKTEIAQLFKNEGYIANFKVIEDRKQGILRVFMKYTPEGYGVIQNLKRVSKPGLRIYRTKKGMPWVYRGLGTAIVTTSRGIFTDKDCRRLGVGGEIIGFIW
ncbi:MAG: 30S ribosomal protein S8 [Elusimicrobiota bacterium]